MVASLLLLLAGAACSAARPRPATAPPRNALEEFLRTSSDARAIAEAARAEGLLADAESDIEDLEAVSAALSIETIPQLGERVAAVVDRSAVLFAALDERRRGSRTGDVAHWVAVALLSLDSAAPAEQRLRTDIDWQAGYLDDVLDLRRLHQEGRLESVALESSAGPERRPESYQRGVVLSLAPRDRPVFRARRQSGYWPVFSSPESTAISGTVTLERNAAIEWDELRVLIRRPGSARVLAAPEEPLQRFELTGDGTLRGAGTATLNRGDQLEVLVQLPGLATLAALSSDAVVELPWDINCCQFLERPDVDWWVRLAGGPAAGAWVLASADAFRVTHPAFQRSMRARSEDRLPRFRLGTLERAGTLDVYGGARLSYWLRGTPGAPPLLVLHGGPGIGSQYLHEPLVEALGESRLLCFFDQRASGYSTGLDDPELITIERAVVDVDQIRRAAGVDRVDILAHSYGGLLALHYALAYPYRVDRLVLVDPDPAIRADWELFRQRVAARTSPEDSARMEEIVATSGWEEDPRLTGTHFALRMRAYVVDPANRIRLYFNQATLPNYHATPEIMRASLGDWDLRDRLGGIEAETLIIAGSESVFPLRTMQELAAAMPDARLEIIEGVGHFPFIEAPEAFAGLVHDFLGR